MRRLEQSAQEKPAISTRITGMRSEIICRGRYGSIMRFPFLRLGRFYSLLFQPERPAYQTVCIAIFRFRQSTDGSMIRYSWSYYLTVYLPTGRLLCAGWLSAEAASRRRKTPVFLYTLLDTYTGPDSSVSRCCLLLSTMPRDTKDVCSPCRRLRRKVRLPLKHRIITTPADMLRSWLV